MRMKVEGLQTVSELTRDEKISSFVASYVRSTLFFI